MKRFFLNIYYFIRRIKNLLLVGANIAFFLSILSNLISPTIFVYIAPFGLLFFFLYIFHLLIFILYIKRKKRIAYPALILVILGSFFIRNTFNITFGNQDEGLKVMSWNVKNFDLYNWTKNKETRQQIFKQIKETNPDIIAIQEFYTNSTTFDNISALKNLGYTNYYFEPTYIQKDNDQWGLAIFSKYPLNQKKLLPSKGQKTKMNRTIRATVSTPIGKINVYAAHFQSIHLGYNDYSYIEDLKKEWKFYDITKTLNILQKIIPAYKYREDQVHTLLEDLDKNNSKTIVCCDLNDIPNSYSYHILSKQLKDSYKEKGFGLSNTVRIGLPLFRIDYIFVSNSLIVNGFEKTNTELSDHNFIVSYIK